jgi:hypothetical protein
VCSRFAFRFSLFALARARGRPPGGGGGADFCSGGRGRGLRIRAHQGDSHAHTAPARADDRSAHCRPPTHDPARGDPEGHGAGPEGADGRCRRPGPHPDGTLVFSPLQDGSRDLRLRDRRARRDRDRACRPRDPG